MIGRKLSGAVYPLVTVVVVIVVDFGSWVLPLSLFTGRKLTGAVSSRHHHHHHHHHHHITTIMTTGGVSSRHWFLLLLLLAPRPQCLPQFKREVLMMVVRVMMMVMVMMVMMMVMVIYIL